MLGMQRRGWEPCLAEDASEDNVACVREMITDALLWLDVHATDVHRGHQVDTAVEMFESERLRD